VADVEPTAVVNGRSIVLAGSVGALGIAAHTAANLRHLRTPPVDAEEVHESVAVLIPARNEVDHVGRTLQSVLDQTGVPNLQVIVLDDGSDDGTGDIVRAIAATDSRVRLIEGEDTAPPAGWLGKPWACARLAAETDAQIACFVDADVVLHPHAVRASVSTLREGGFALVAPYPLQLAGSWLERLVQPLVTWSWAATMPLGWAERSHRPSLSAANGQILVLDRGAYGAIGGHVAVRSNVLEDIGMMRALKVAGYRTATVDGSRLAECRMYEGSSAVIDGYAKSLWSAFGGPAGSVATCSLLVLCFVVPAVAAVGPADRRTRAIGLAGYLAGVTSRALVARRTGERIAPDTFAQPASIAAFVGLNAVSWWRHRRGSNAWKGRAVTTGATA
jgi:hypothetical protein